MNSSFSDFNVFEKDHVDFGLYSAILTWKSLFFSYSLKLEKVKLDPSRSVENTQDKVRASGEAMRP